MARTRAQDNKVKNNSSSSIAEETSAVSQPPMDKQASSGTKRHQGQDGNGKELAEEEEKSNAEKPPAFKKVKANTPSQDEDKEQANAIDKTKLNTIMEAYGVLPLSDSGLINPKEAKPETILALVYMAMLTSARISHGLAYKSVKCLLEAGYHDLMTLQKSTWQQRTEVLTEGGYTRYREKTATALGELADLVETKYNGDLNNLLKEADSSPTKIRSLLQEIKGIGKVGMDIFCDAAQAAWPCLAPFIDPRSMETAKECGLGNDVTSMWDAVGHDPVGMCKLSSALTMIRLDKKEGDFK